MLKSLEAILISKLRPREIVASLVVAGVALYATARFTAAQSPGESAGQVASVPAQFS
jgi:hypothetical protein